MSKHQAAMLACRILAIYAFLQGILRFASMGMIPMYLQNPTPDTRELFMAVAVASPALYLLTFSAVLWIFAGRFAYYMTLDMPPGEAWSGIRADDMLRMGFVLCGLFILGNAFTSMSGSIFYFFLIQGRQAVLNQPELAIQPVTESIAFLLKLGIGVWFVARPGQVIRLLRKFTGEDRES